MKKTHYYKYYIISLIVLLLILSFAFLFPGRYHVEPSEVLKVLRNNILRTPEDSVENTVVWDIRLPRILLAILVGAGLAVSGASFQGCFHNPLVSPDVLGVSSGAGFGAAVGILLTSGTTGLTSLLAFGFGILSVVLSWMFSRIKQEDRILALVLSGMIVSTIFNALLSLIKLVADTDTQLPTITFWLMGSFTNTTFDCVKKVSIPIIGGIGVLLALRWHINVLTLGDDEAKALGINPVKIRILIIAASTMITASCVMVTGIIGWVGLIMPNLCRMLVGADYKRLMPVVCLSGGVFMLIVDFIARSLTAAEIPIGILTALVGAPIFFIVYKRSNEI